MDKEKLIKRIMKECEADGEPVTREEAEEMAEMEIKANKDCRRYETDVTKKRKPAQREPKIDPDKVTIIDSIAHQLTRCVWLDSEKEISDIQIINSQKEIAFKVGEDSYSVTLTKHRVKKK